MKLIMLGTVGYHPSENRHTTCLMLPSAGVVFDAGTGFFRVGQHLQTKTLDIFLTHIHLDHSFGLTILLGLMSQHRLERVCIHGEESKLRSVREHLFHPDLFPVLPQVEWITLGNDYRLSDGGRLTHWPQEHPNGSRGYRVDWDDGKSFAFVTDTVADPNADYVRYLHGVDLLVHECNFEDEQRDVALYTGHSHATPVAHVAQKAQVKRLLLTHFSPTADPLEPIRLAPVRAIFPATEIATDGLVVEW